MGFWIEIVRKDGKVQDYLEIINGKPVICGWESFGLGYYRKMTLKEAEHWADHFAEEAKRDGVRLVVRF